jgi:hypothetical protein
MQAALCTDRCGWQDGAPLYGGGETRGIPVFDASVRATLRYYRLAARFLRKQVTKDKHGIDSLQGNRIRIHIRYAITFEGSSIIVDAVLPTHDSPKGNRGMSHHPRCRGLCGRETFCMRLPFGESVCGHGLFFAYQLEIDGAKRV